MLKSRPFIVTGWDPWSKKRVNYLSCIEGKGVLETFTVVNKIKLYLLIYYELSIDKIVEISLYLLTLSYYTTFGIFIDLYMIITYLHQKYEITVSFSIVYNIFNAFYRFQMFAIFNEFLKNFQGKKDYFWSIFSITSIWIFSNLDCL